MDFPKFDENDVIKFDDGTQWYLTAEETNEFEAELIRGHLKSANIEAELINQIDSAKLITIGESAVVKIFVRKEDYTKALELLQEINSKADEASEENTEN